MHLSVRAKKMVVCVCVRACVRVSGVCVCSIRVRNRGKKLMIYKRTRTRTHTHHGQRTYSVHVYYGKHTTIDIEWVRALMCVSATRLCARVRIIRPHSISRSKRQTVTQLRKCISTKRNTPNQSPRALKSDKKVHAHAFAHKNGAITGMQAYAQRASTWCVCRRDNPPTSRVIGREDCSDMTAMGGSVFRKLCTVTGKRNLRGVHGKKRTSSKQPTLAQYLYKFNNNNCSQMIRPP